MLRLGKELKTDSNEVNGGRRMRGSHERLCFSDKERGKALKGYMEKIMNEENDCDRNVEGEAVEGACDCCLRGNRNSYDG